MPGAVIFDFDGVIVDSEPLHWRAFQRVLEPMGFFFSWEEYLAGYVGLDDRGALRKVFRHYGRPLDDESMRSLIEKKALVFQAEVAHGVVPYPGVVELIQEVAAARPIALCSGALRSDILPVLEQLDLSSIFAVIVTADDVNVSKPDPESYRLAFRKLSDTHPSLRNPSASIAIEDTPAGIASARGAGLTVLAVTNNFPPEKLSSATRITRSLEGWSLADLSETVANPSSSGS